MTVAPPRLHVLWHVELHGEDAAINDLEKLEHETKQARATQPVQDARDLDQVTGALLWKVHGHRFGGGGKKNKRAFDEFCARVGDGADDVGAAWLVGKCDALGSSLGALDVALGVLDAAKKSDAEMQGALMELLGFGDAALTLMGELCEKKAAVAAVDAARVQRSSRRWAAAAAGGSVRIGGEKKQSQRSKKQQRKARAARTGPSEAADYLEALGFDERYLAQERSLGLQKNVVEERMSHAEDLLGGAEREYRETRSGLPAGAEKFYGEGYEEVEIPPPKALPPPGPGELRQLADCLPPWAVACFPKSTTHKAVYVAPLKALAQEVVDKFKERLAPLGMIVKELTGDAQLAKKDADAAHVLVVTPEKWDVVTRKQGGGGGGDSMGSLASRCRLLIVDEIHLLAEERGAVLECVVARTTRLVESSQSQARLVGLSATLPNYEDVGSFLGCADDSVFFFGPEFRPVPLKQTFVGVTETKRFQKLVKLDDLAFDVALSAVDRGHQAMIFVHSRRETFKTAMALRDRANRDGRDGAFKPAEDLGNLLKPFAPALAKCKHKELREAAEAGFGLHHAGMCRADRSLSGACSPGARGGHVDLSMLDVLQIFGRAGRPQFDDFGEATLLTTQKALPDYLRKLARAAPIESCLPARLADAINAEVAAGTVASLKDAGRFLAVRLRKNPLAYGCPYDQAREDPGMGRFRETLLRDACKRLDESRMCRYDRRSGAVAGTEVGRVGSHFYLRHESVREFNERLRQHATDADILVVVCSAYEFEQLKPRSDEVAELDRLRESEVCCPVRSDELFALADEPAGKAATLLQAHVSRAPFSAFTLASDAAYVAKNAARVCRALFEMALRAHWPSLAERLLALAKAVERRLWWFQHPLRQLADLEPNLNERRRKFPEDALRQLEAKRLTVDRILGDLNGDPREVPSVTLEADVKPITRTVLRVTLTVTPTYHWEPRTHGLGPEP
ncbi:hypothetical protein JL721_11220 [Aureococcus anophagefferens]|nr:hypothetical protein JL721_11220 [Aureococcus anophagefferens]